MRIKIKKHEIQVNWFKYISHNFTLNIKKAINISSQWNDGFHHWYPMWFRDNTNLAEEYFDDGDGYWDECSAVQSGFNDWLRDNFGNVNWNKINVKDFLNKKHFIHWVDGYTIDEDDNPDKLVKLKYYVYIYWMDHGRLFFDFGREDETTNEDCEYKKERLKELLNG